MRLRIFRSAVLAVAVLVGGVAPALAFDDFPTIDESYYYAAPDESVELRGGLGIIGIEAREHVFAGAGSPDNLSLLIWQSIAPMANVGITIRLPDDWTVEARATAALSGDSYMEDFDWLAPFRPSFDFNDWTDRSQHPDTNLDWYLDGSVALGKDFMVGDGVRANVNGGFKYTDVQWAAAGGDFVYSLGGFRDTSGTFADTPAITYRQQLPTFFVGLDAEVEDNGWTFATSARGGYTLFGLATDHHWMRVPPLRFEDMLHPTPMVSLSARAGYDMSDNLELFAEGALEKVFLARADTDIYNNSTGTLIGQAGDGGGAELGTISVSAGLKGSF